MWGSGTVNADGFGVGWYPGDGDEPLRYRRVLPIWADSGFPELAHSIAAGAVLAAVRSASVGMPVAEIACAPFAGDGWLFSHNGLIAGWPHTMSALAAELPVTDLLTLDAPTDSALLWALIRRRLRADGEPWSAVADIVRRTAAAAPGSRLNLLLTDGETIVATAWGHALSLLAIDDRVVLASEPWDDDARWTAVPDGELIVASRRCVRRHRLDQEAEV